MLAWNLQGVPTISELGFATAALPKPVKVAAVTGTNGKSTVTTFTGQVFFLLISGYNFILDYRNSLAGYQKEDSALLS